MFTGSDTRVLTKSRDRTIERVLQGGRESYVDACVCVANSARGCIIRHHTVRGPSLQKAIGGGLAVFKNTARPRACGLEERT